VPLQRLLWALGCRWTAHAHQIEAVRFCAGVPPGWPTHYPPEEEEEEEEALGEGRGVVLGDDMGLGKTFSAIGAIVVREFLAARRGEDLAALSTVVVAPTEAVLSQWRDSLQQSGFGEGEVLVYTGDFSPRALRAPALRGRSPYPRLVLLHKWKLQADQRAVFSHLKADPPAGTAADAVPLGPRAAGAGGWRQRASTAAAAAGTAGGAAELPPVPSPLMPSATAACARALQAAYEADKGRKAKGRSRYGTCDPVKLARRLAQEGAAFAPSQRCWLTFVLDEAHELRNPFSFWAMAAALMGQHARRVVLATGTPYNNREGDLATLSSFIEPGAAASAPAFWREARDALEGSGTMKEEHRSWLALHLLMRDKSVLATALPPKSVSEEAVLPSGPERQLYSPVEEVLIKSLRNLVTVMKRKASGKAAAARKRRDLMRLQKRCMGLAQEARMVLIHPALGGKGREVTAPRPAPPPPAGRPLCRPPSLLPPTLSPSPQSSLRLLPSR